MCLCGLSDRDRKVAHEELVGVQMLMEDVLLGSCHVIGKASTEWQATLDSTQVIPCTRATGLLVLGCTAELPIFRDRLERGLAVLPVCPGSRSQKLREIAKLT